MILGYAGSNVEGSGLTRALRFRPPFRVVATDDLRRRRRLHCDVKRQLKAFDTLDEHSVTEHAVSV